MSVHLKQVCIQRQMLFTKRACSVVISIMQKWKKEASSLADNSLVDWSVNEAQSEAYLLQTGDLALSRKHKINLRSLTG